jgi:hypothetical protein
MIPLFFLGLVLYDKIDLGMNLDGHGSPRLKVAIASVVWPQEFDSGLLPCGVSMDFTGPCESAP